MLNKQVLKYLASGTRISNFSHRTRQAARSHTAAISVSEHTVTVALPSGCGTRPLDVCVCVCVNIHTHTHTYTHTPTPWYVCMNMQMQIDVVCMQDVFVDVWGQGRYFMCIWDINVNV